ncbi:ABC transporter substrate-binding protein [uncultured Ezakiella sp.]|uniref:ABC transporter substrate-binding protein n=1 Tax=uncultured Ezakiella sp. TaxID=1637529 RepID=UPI0025F4033E|nr:ABC transporter substrate-binding protein [uncultured Ezakiella sp.]
MKKKFVYLITLILVLFLSLGCSNKESKTIGNLTNIKNQKIVGKMSVEGGSYPKTIKDYQGEEVTLEKPFERAAVLSATPLNIWYDLGGKSICTSEISENVKLIPEYKDEITKLPKVGRVFSINMEAVIEQEPDLIIAQVGTQSTQAKKFRDMGINTITTYVKTFEDVINTYDTFGKILNNEEKANEKIEYLISQKELLESKAPKNGDSIVILYVTGNGISVKLDNSIAGDVAKILGLKNIASDLKPDSIGSENTPLDIEYIVESNPDYVLVTSMVESNEEAIKIMEEEFNNNPIWSGVEAIKENKVIYLPQQYFLFNAGPYYDEAIEYMAMSIYPEIYGNVRDKYEK